MSIIPTSSHPPIPGPLPLSSNPFEEDTREIVVNHLSFAIYLFPFAIRTSLTFNRPHQEAGDC